MNPSPATPDQKNPHESEAQKKSLRDVVALSTLPAVWLGAEPMRVAESLAAALYTSIDPEFVYVSFAGGPGYPPISVVQVERYAVEPDLAPGIRTAIVEWASRHDPDELMRLEYGPDAATLCVAARSIGLNAELGVIAAAFREGRPPGAQEHLILNVATSQAGTAIQNARLVRALRESVQERDRAAQALRESRERIERMNAELSLRVSELQRATVELQQSRRAALNVMEDAVEAREALSQRTAQFETLLNAAPLGVYLVDANFRLREVNPTAVPFFGDILGLIGRDFEEVMRLVWPENHASEVVRRFRHTLATGEPYFVSEQAEQRLDTGAGEYHEWQINRIPLPDGGYGVVCYFRDISAQVQARSAIARAAEQLRFMAESMPQKIFTATPDGEVDYANRQWAEYTGLPLGSLLASGWASVVHPDDLEENVRLWRRSIESGEPFQFVHRFRRNDGKYRWHLSRAQAMRGEDGGITMWIGSNTEIHEQKVTEEELRIANQDLEQFAYSASHDLQEPLRSIQIYSQLIARRYSRNLDEDGLQYLEYLTDGARRMQMLIRDLLAYTQISRIDVPAGTSDSGQALSKAVANLQESIAESGARITWDDLPSCAIHSAHLEQLFQNLIGNAIKYRDPARTPVVHVSAEAQGQWRQFSVQDNGIGIEPQYLDRIFGLFKRLHSKEEYSGTGIGLALCQRIVERYRGRIWVESAPGEGSTFRFTLPA